MSGGGGVHDDSRWGGVGGGGEGEGERGKMRREKCK